MKKIEIFVQHCFMLYLFTLLCVHHHHMHCAAPAEPPENITPHQTNRRDCNNQHHIYYVRPSTISPAPSHCFPSALMPLAHVFLLFSSTHTPTRLK